MRSRNLVLGLVALAGLVLVGLIAQRSSRDLDQQLSLLDQEAREAITAERLTRELPAVRATSPASYCVREVHDLGRGGLFATQLCFDPQLPGTADQYGNGIAMEVRYHQPFRVDPDRPPERPLTVDTPSPGMGVALIYEDGSMIISVPPESLPLFEG